MMVFGGYLIYQHDTEVDLTWASAEVGIFILGVYFCLLSDSVFKKKEKRENDAEV